MNATRYVQCLFTNVLYIVNNITPTAKITNNKKCIDDE